MSMTQARRIQNKSPGIGWKKLILVVLGELSWRMGAVLSRLGKSSEVIPLKMTTIRNRLAVFKILSFWSLLSLKFSGFKKQWFAPTNQRFSESPKTCNIISYKKTTQPRTTAMLRPIFIQNPYLKLHANNWIGSLVLLEPPHNFHNLPSPSIRCWYVPLCGIYELLVDHSHFAKAQIPVLLSVSYQISIRVASPT